jgi:hypothetical protein
MDVAAGPRDNSRGMGRYTFPAYNKATTPSYVVVWDLQWQVIDCQRLEPAHGSISLRTISLIFSKLQCIANQKAGSRAKIGIFY